MVRVEGSADGYNVELHAKIGKGRQLNLERFQSLVRITDRLMGNDDASGGVGGKPNSFRSTHGLKGVSWFQLVKRSNTKRFQI